MKNRWGTDIRKGVKVSAHHPRGGTITGRVTGIHTLAGYGKRASLDTGNSISIDDVFKVHTATLVPVRLEGWAHGRAYQWVEGFKVIDPEGNELQPYMRKLAARQYCKAQGWQTREVQS